MERKYLFEAGLDVYTSFKTLVPIENLAELPLVTQSSGEAWKD